MTPVEAAKLIGVTPGTVRKLIRDGVLKAKQSEAPGWRLGVPMYVYKISEAEVKRFLRMPLPKMGRKRGPLNGTSR